MLCRWTCGKPVVITGASSRVGLQGMGGIGKSVLAAAVARYGIRRSYPDGVIGFLGRIPHEAPARRPSSSPPPGTWAMRAC